MNKLNDSVNRIVKLSAIRVCVSSFILMTATTFSFAETSDPITVESRSESRLSEVEEPFQAPVEAQGETQLPAMESQYRQQLLQQDVQKLRGLVEELANEMERLKRTSDDRYLELDGRFQALREEVSTSGSLVVGNPATSKVSQGVASASPSEVAGVVTGQDEKTLYDTSLELIRNRQYDLAITQLQAVITQYPDGNYAPNAYYWLGEVYAAKPQPDYENARQALAQVITFFPENRKVPDAAFKLGKVYHLMGDCDRAKELLNQIIAQHQGRSVAKLAETYLRNKMESCGSQ
jgi:tol-pal system protein YbgF